ncbi:HupE/UreJ family protein [Altererythrobacter sp. GH1-8]|uniref:HupE/UreJ family protein n=1 Tax=Altererythrobacter sp. GH1-8 TaxID=3349333 RepID=UPI00374D91B3
MRWLFAAVLALLAHPALADEVRPMALDFTEQSACQWTLTWKQPVATGAAAFVKVQPPDNCAFIGEPIVRRANAAYLGSAELQCEGPVAGKGFGLEQMAPGSDALLRVAPLDEPVQSLRLSASEPSATILAKPDRGQVLRSYFVIGAEHILMGWDHLLFVIALVLLVKRGWAVVSAATAFTVSHSITLAASVLGFAGLPQGPVEALIALSILFLAVELTRTDRETWTRRWPWLVAFAFGLLHGFGFAGALSEIGLPQGEVPAALLAFNLGVEAGQILVILAVLALRASVARLAPKAEAPALKFATYAIGIIASYWLFDRVLF